jgi:hypothetical protein
MKVKLISGLMVMLSLAASAAYANIYVRAQKKINILFLR